MAITVRFTGVADAVSAIEFLKAKIDLATRQGTVKSGQMLQSLAVANFQGFHSYGYPHIGGNRPNTVTGNLQRSITAWPVVPLGNATYSVTVNPTAIYSRIIELGGTITPKREGGYLSWESPYMGRRVFRKQVTLRGWPYFRPAYDDTVAIMPSIFNRYWEGAMNA